MNLNTINYLNDNNSKLINNDILMLMQLKIITLNNNWKTDHSNNCKL